jgi:8-oxo-dGTP pyrophosphatase MutT (NUDIX family)
VKNQDPSEKRELKPTTKTILIRLRQSEFHNKTGTVRITKAQRKHLPTTAKEFKMSRVEAYLAKISQALKPMTEESDANAAVVLLLRARGRGFEVLFVKRAENPTDFWSGQVALPGGRREVQDESLRQTAIRETLEEIGIDLTYGCRFLGVLKASTSAGRHVKVLPFVFFLEHEATVRLNRNELEEHVWIGLRSLIDNRGTTRVGFAEVPSFIVANYLIWGLTYRILDEFLDLLKSPKV